MRNLVVLLASVAALAAGIGTVSAAGGADVHTRTVSFTLSSDVCPNLASGTTINGTGTEKSISNVRTDQSGVMTIQNNTHTHGTATDADGNTYVFNYSNQFRITNSSASPSTFTGTMNDSFSLAGSAQNLTNGFHAGVTFEFDQSGNIVSATFDPVQDHGDPLDFSTGAAICDPL